MIDDLTSKIINLCLSLRAFISEEVCYSFSRLEERAGSVITFGMLSIGVELGEVWSADCEWWSTQKLNRTYQ